MHILHVAGSLGTGGIEKLVFELAEHQRADGHEVSVAVLWRPKTPDQQRVALLREERLAAIGVEVLQIAHGPRAVSAATRSLRAHYRHTHVDIVHAHLVAGAASARMALGRRAALVLTLHSTEFGFPRQLLRLSGPFVDRYVACGDSVAASLRPFTRRTIETVSNGVDLTDFASLAASRTPPPFAQFRVISVGALRPEKAYPRIIEAAKTAGDRLQEQGIDLRLSIAGDGELRTELETLIGRLEANGYVTLLGTRTDIPELLSKADCLAMASDHEGLPLALIEAMAAGLPSILTPFEGAQAISHDGRTSLVVPNFTVEAFASALIRMATDEDLWLRLACGSLARAPYYSIERCAAQYGQVYAEALSGGRR